MRALVAALVLALLGVAPAAAAPPDRWVGTWSGAVTTVPAGDSTAFEDQTIRQVVRTSVGGDSVRVRLSNEFGTAPLVVGETHVALRASGARAVPSTDRLVTFGGRTSVTIPPGAPALSDPIPLRLKARVDLLVSIHLPGHTPGTTTSAFAYQRNYIAAGNVTGSADITPTGTTDRWYFLSGVSVRSSASAVVAFGDSITAGTSLDANNRWSDYLARRAPHLGVLNKGIAGNRLLHDPNPPAGSPAEGYAALFGESGLRRLDRDVLVQPGARYVVVLLGVNDIGHPGTPTAPASEKVTAADIIAGHSQLIARAHERGLKVYGGTITPFRDDAFGFYSPENEATRQEVNRWIRTGGAFDAVIDFDRALRDPAAPDRLLAAFDSGDHLHPNDKGNEAMAEAIPLRLFR